MEKNALATLPALVVGTPGRILDHINQGSFDPSTIKFLILDEFDKSLELGFQAEMEAVISKLSGIKKRMLLSATKMEEIPAFTKIHHPMSLDFLGNKETLRELTVYKVQSPIKAASESEGGTVEVRVGGANGTLIGTCDITGTSGWTEFKEFECKTKQCTGVNDVYLIFTGTEPYLFNVADFSFYGIKGDINGDRVVDTFDLILGRQAITGKTELEGLSRSNADIEVDEKIAISDMVLLQKYLLGSSSKL